MDIGWVVVENCGLEEEMMLASTEEDMKALDRSGAT